VQRAPRLAGGALLVAGPGFVEQTLVGPDKGVDGRVCLLAAFEQRFDGLDRRELTVVHPGEHFGGAELVGHGGTSAEKTAGAYKLWRRGPPVGRTCALRAQVISEGGHESCAIGPAEKARHKPCQVKARIVPCQL